MREGIGRHKGRLALRSGGAGEAVSWEQQGQGDRGMAGAGGEVEGKLQRWGRAEVAYFWFPGIRSWAICLCWDTVELLFGTTMMFQLC